MLLKPRIFLLLMTMAIIGCQPTTTAPVETNQKPLPEFFNLEIGSSWEYLLSYSKTEPLWPVVHAIGAKKTIKLKGVAKNFDTTIFAFSISDTVLNDYSTTPADTINQLSDSSGQQLERLSGFGCKPGHYSVSFFVTPKSPYPQAIMGWVGFDLFLKGPVKLDSMNYTYDMTQTKVSSKVMNIMQWHGNPHYIANFPNPESHPPIFVDGYSYFEKIGLLGSRYYSGSHGWGLRKSLELLKFNGQDVVFSAQ